MSLTMRRGRFLFLGLSVIACAQTPMQPSVPQSKPAVWRAVHIDTVDQAKVPQFENARRGWLVALKTAGLSDERGFFIQVGANRFLTLVPFADFTELDHLNKARGVAPQRLKAAVASYDRDSDSALIPPHHSELWRQADYLTYRPAQGALTERSFAAGYMVVDDVFPGPRGEGYYTAWDEMHAALAKAHYPLTHLAFSSSYGSGKVIHLWLATSRAELETTPAVLDVVTQILGKEKVDALVREQNASLASSEKFGIARRADLDSPTAPVSSRNPH